MTLRRALPWLFAILAWGVLTIALFGQPQAGEHDAAQARHAVVKVSIDLGRGQYTGGSATVIVTGAGRTVLLSAAHVFSGQARGRPIRLEAPHPVAGPPVKAGVRVVATDEPADLALLEMAAGPLPYVAPVAPEGSRPAARLLSVGYDDGKQPATARPASVVQDAGGWTHTRERPWHGRSGGALIDEASGQLYGVVSGYSGPTSPTRQKAQFQEVYPGAHGIYASHAAVVAFCRKHGVEPGRALLPPVQAPAPWPGQQLRQPLALPGGT